MSEPGYVARFDSASAMVRALAAHLVGRSFPRLGTRVVSGLLTRLATLLPDRPSEAVYRWGGWSEAVPARRIADVDEAEISSWLGAAYLRRRYPAVAVGSSNGAAVHLCAALGIPWLPQTVLVPPRRHLHVDDLAADLAFGRDHAPEIVDRNPHLVLHQMADPSQDRIMLERQGYFRIKRTRLGAAELRFLEDVLEPGGTLLVIDCTTRWPAVAAGPRHWFQVGGSGGTTPEEYVDGGARVASFLAEQGSPRREWDVGEPVAQVIESEWGFEPALHEHLQELADRNQWTIRRLRFDQPDHLSPLVADLHRWWYRRLDRPAGHLHVSSFFLLDPHLSLLTGQVPYWTSFPVDPAARELEDWLDHTEPFEEIGITLFSHGTRSIGLAEMDRWEAIRRRATRQGRWMGTRPSDFPRDFNVFARYHTALEALDRRLPLPPPLTLGDLDEFLQGYRGPVRMAPVAGPSA